MTYRLQTLKELLKEVKSLKSLNYYSLTDSCLEGLCVEWLYPLTQSPVEEG